MFLASIKIWVRNTGLPTLWGALAIVICFPVAALAAGEVRHTVSFPEDREQVILVRSEFPVDGAVTELIMPNWTPGSYKIRNFAGNVSRIVAVSDEGSVLSLEKVAKDRWQVDTGQVSKLLVEYEVYTPELGVQTSWASSAFTLINGASVFLYTEHSRELPHTLNIRADRERGEVFTALPALPGEAGFRAKGFDELVDSPVAVANAPTYRFTHKQQDYVLLNVGENQFWDGQQAARDVRKVVVENQLFWRINPLERPFWFMNVIVEGRGGLEHDHSTVLMTGRRDMRDRDKYIKWLSLVAHEFFHVWNVRRMRPVELSESEYQVEQYTSQLWLAEGLSSYYDNLLLSRAGLVTPKEYLELLARDIHRLETTPGRLVRPVTETSFDAWIGQYQPNANSINNTVSYYTKGAIIGFVLDTYIRKISKNRHNLDEVMREMYRRHASQPYDRDAFTNVVTDVAGEAAAEFLEPLLNTTAEPDVDSALEWYGLKLDRKNINAAKSGKTDEKNGPPASGLGVVFDESEPGMVVKAVLAGSSGASAGLLPADEVLAVGGERLTPGGLDDLMGSFRPGEEATVLISRRGKIIELNITLGNAIPERFEIVLQTGYKNSQVKRLQRWLGQEVK